MAKAFISDRTARTISQLRIRGWLTAFATSDPQVTLTFSYIDDDGDTHYRDPQDVVITHLSILGTGERKEPAADITDEAIDIRRPLDEEFGFDVAVDDRFQLEDKTGVVLHTRDIGGMRYATARVTTS